jgi:sugar lactone lactonase YvrE
MKQKLIIGLSLISLLIVIVFMAKDFFRGSNLSQTNPYEYKLDNLKNIDPALITYSEINQIKPGVNNPAAIAIDGKDQIYICGDTMLVKFDSEGNQILSFDIHSAANCINVSPSGDIYLSKTDHIEVRKPDGNVKALWKIINEKAVITSIATTDEFVFAADAGNKIVYQYNLNGQIIKEIGKKDTLTGAPGFIIPSPYFDLLIGTQGKLWVVNPGRHAFENYDFNGNLISSWNRTSMLLEGFSGCCNPTHIALLSDGSYVTSEKGLERIKIHAPNGDFKTVVAAPESFIEGTTGLDLAVDSKDRIYVLDPVKKLIRVFEKK